MAGSSSPSAHSISPSLHNRKKCSVNSRGGSPGQCLFIPPIVSSLINSQAGHCSSVTAKEWRNQLCQSSRPSLSHFHQPVSLLPFGTHLLEGAVNFGL